MFSVKDNEGYYSEDFTLEEIRTLRAKERLPSDIRTHQFDYLFQVITLDEFLQFVSGINNQTGNYRCNWNEEIPSIGVYIETKTPSHFRSLGYDMEGKLLDSLHKWGYEDKCKESRDIDDPANWAISCGVILQSFENNLKDQLPTNCSYPRIQVILLIIR